MKVCILGKLGDVVKKVFELEALLVNFPSNSLFIAELASHQQILALWPIDDSLQSHIAIASFKLSLAKLKEAEKDLMHVCEDANTDYLLYAHRTMRIYCKALLHARAHLELVNGLGKHVGPSPFMEIADATLESAQSEDHQSSG